MSLNNIVDRAERTLLWLTEFYERVFSLEEIRKEPILQWSFGASLFYFFVTFEGWISRAIISPDGVQQGLTTCWPYFQNCTHLYFLRTFPYGYSQSTFYMFLYGIMCLVVYLMWKKEWTKAHALLFVLFVWKAFVICVLSFIAPGPYDFYHLILTAILLFVPFKEFFLKLAFVWMYFMSVTVKFTPAWILGTYFTSLRSGLPIFPDWATVLLTNLVIFVQIVDCWFLMARNWILQRISFWFAVTFHLYSGVLVSYNYPSAALLPLLVLFGPMYRYTPTPFGKKSIGGWTIIILIGLFQLLGFAVSRDRFITLEGHRYGMFMFEANHQCIATFSTYSEGTLPNSHWEGLLCGGGLYCTIGLDVKSSKGQVVIERTIESASAWNRCDPYEVWQRARLSCADPSVSRVAMRFDHSVNGGPFYRIIDESSICDLTYKPFSHNEWIKVPPEAPLIGYPVENFYSRRL